MSIHVKIATTEKELNDVYKLRYQVYVESEGYYQHITEPFITDKFDSQADVANIIAYNGDTPIGTMRANLDSENRLPADQVVDFTSFREHAIKEAKQKNLPPPVFGGSSMLAIAKPWRNNPVVFKEMIRLSVEAGEQWQVTHLISIINAKVARLHQRLGWAPLSEKQWFEDANEYIVPMATELASIRNWYAGTQQ
jgi:N-acyl-L-homoserine lactone synthetase